MGKNFSGINMSHLKGSKAMKSRTSQDSEISKSIESQGMELTDHGNSSGSVTIFRTPKGYWRYFDPVIFTIGPYSWFRQDTKKIKVSDKEWFRDDLLSELQPEKKNEVIQKCREQMSRQEVAARRCYEKPDQELDHITFVEMLLLDGFLILSIMLRFANGVHADLQSNEASNQIRILTSYLNLVKLDLLKLRNQLPFFVLVDLVNILKDHVPKLNNFNLVDFALGLFNDVSPQKSPAIESPAANVIHHLLHLYHSVLVPTPGYRMTNTQLCNPSVASSQNGRAIWIPSVSALEKSDIRCRRKEATCSFLDVSFCNGVLQIPSMVIDELSISLFISLIVFENYCSPEILHTRFISAYITFIGNIVHSEEDVTRLCTEGVVASCANAAQVLDFFVETRKLVRLDPASNYLHYLSQKVSTHYKNRWARWFAELKQKHLQSPWVIGSLVAGFILLSCSILQTVYTVLGYYWTIRHSSHVN